MSDYWLNVFATWGQLIAGSLALFAAAVGIISSYAANQLTKASNEQLVKAAVIIERLDRQVGNVIGGTWAPLTSNQIAELAESIRGLAINHASVNVMYENVYGREFAESVATALQAGGWTVSLSPGGGFMEGIVVGPGPIGLRIQKIFAERMRINRIRSLRPEEKDSGHYFVGIGANVQ